MEWNFTCQNEYCQNSNEIHSPHRCAIKNKILYEIINVICVQNLSFDRNGLELEQNELYPIIQRVKQSTLRDNKTSWDRLRLVF